MPMTRAARARVKQYTIFDLLPEILSKIFQYLSVNERKIVKLVCKFWLTCCNVPSLLNEEVLISRENTKLSDMYQLLIKSERLFLNLKFEKIIFFDRSPFEVFNGLRIRSIIFIDCQFSSRVFQDIIISCQNLFHLSFTYTVSFYHINPERDSFPLINDLERVSRKGIVRENLSSLEISMYNSKWIYFSDYILHQFFVIFPKIKILKITSDFGSSQNIDLDLSELPNKTHLTMSPVLNYLTASSERIEKLKLDFTKAKFSPDSLRCILEAVSSLRRLKKLYIATRNVPEIEDIGSIFNLKQLRSLEFRITLRSYDLSSFLSQILNSNSNLQYLKIHQPYTSFIVTKEFYEQLVSSGLKTFFIMSDGIYLQNHHSFGSCTVAQNKTTLPSLSVSVRSNPLPEKTLPFFQYYQSLHHYQVGRITEKGLQFLLKYQKKLRSLIIDSDNVFQIFDISPDDLSFNELTDIEYLELKYAPIGPFFLSTLLPEPILAKLKYLSIDVSALSAAEQLLPVYLLRAANVMPFLEGLRVYAGQNISFGVIVELCTKLRRLRYLSYKGSWLVEGGVVERKHFEEIFSNCPSLRALVHNGSEFNIYYSGGLQKKVYKKEESRRYSLGKPQIGEFIVSWMEY